MAELLATKARKKSTYVITVSFRDEDGNAITPQSASWTLTDSSGAVINSRSAVSMTPATSVDVLLKGDDLDLQAGESIQARRLFTVEATYNSTLGSNLPLKKEFLFDVVDLSVVS